MHKQWGRVHWTTLFFGCPLTHDRSIYPLLSLCHWRHAEPLLPRPKPTTTQNISKQPFSILLYPAAVCLEALLLLVYKTHTREKRQMASWFTRVPDRRHSVAPSLVSCPLPFFSVNTGNVHSPPYNNGSSCLTWNSAGAIVLVVCQKMSRLSVFVFNSISGRHVVWDNVVAPEINLIFDYHVGLK